jgi:hypothetical protein
MKKNFLDVLEVIFGVCGIASVITGTVYIFTKWRVKRAAKAIEKKDAPVHSGTP